MDRGDDEIPAGINGLVEDHGAVQGLADVAPGLEILHARTFEPAYALKPATWEADRGRARRRFVARLGGVARSALVPDPQILWQPHAQLVLARRLLGARRDDVVFISGPPFSQFLLAPLARTRAAVVLDYRDECVT